MTDLAIKPQPYTVSGVHLSKPAKETRVQVASAIVLAQRWIEEGYLGVEIVDPVGMIWTPDQLRAHRMNLHRRPAP